MISPGALLFADEDLDRGQVICKLGRWDVRCVIRVAVHLSQHTKHAVRHSSPLLVDLSLINHVPF